VYPEKPSKSLNEGSFVIKLNSELTAHIIDITKLPTHYPTHHHSVNFWEALGRTVATFGYLEDILARAIVALSATQQFPPDQLEAEYEKFISTAEKAATDPLGSLITTYEKIFQAHTEAKMEGFDKLIEDLRKSSGIRNMICHARWLAPDEQGYSRPRFMTTKGKTPETGVDTEYLNQVQSAVAEIACNVENSVTHLGWQFPGSGGLGMPIMRL
jgi:hypothetical protein